MIVERIPFVVLFVGFGGIDDDDDEEVKPSESAMYRSILVAVKPGSTNDAVTALALGLAKQHSLRVSGLAVIDAGRIAPIQAVPLGASAFKAHRDEALLQEARAAAEATLESFRQRSRAAGIECVTLLREGNLESEIARAVQSADLLLAGHNSTSAAADTTGALHSVLKHSARPTLVVPRLPTNAAHVAVAYDESAQAARALHDFATSGLWQGREVHVISLAADSPLAVESVEQAVAYLKLHHFTATGHPLATSHDIGRHILDFLGEIGACMLVMGAYGKPAWREFMFGSVTRTVLSTSPVPVFLSH